MKIIPLSEGTFTIDKTKYFVPFDLDNDHLQERPVGSLLVEVQPFVVITERDTILLDTGLGFQKNGRLQLYQNLQTAGIEPGQITAVLMSHLHKDHAGGVGTSTDSDAALAFPQARYYVQRAELAFADEKGFPSYITEELNVLRNAAQVEWLDGDGQLDDQVRYQVTGAHSPFHQVFWIREGKETIFYGADDAPQLHQMRHKFVAKYDHDGKKAMELRQQWWQQGEREKWTFLFYHDVKHPTYQFG